MARFKRVPLEVEAKIVEHDIVLPTKRGVDQGFKGEFLVTEGGEKHFYKADAFMRLFEPVSTDAHEILEYAGSETKGKS